jgi:DNA-3-methyladenine glycosylase
MSSDFELLQNHKKLTREFYLRPTLTVAKNLLGKIFVKIESDQILSAIITEVEAYDGLNDEASHSFKGETNRNKDMFKIGGHSYIYFTYGVHHCLNVVVGRKNFGAAVLIRSMEPISGIKTFAERRFGKTDIIGREYLNLLNGPGKICQAFNLTRKDSGKDLIKDEMFILDNKKINRNMISVSKRIGISKSVDLLWRFFIFSSKFLSR